MEKQKSIIYNFIMNSILKMSSFLFPLITFPYISRILGAEGNGKIAIADAFVSYFVMIASLGIPTYGIRVCAQCRDDKEKLSKVVHELLIISTIMTILSYVILYALVFFVPAVNEKKTLIFIYSITIVLSTFGIEWFYQAIEQYGYITYRNLIFKIISIGLMFAFVKEKEDYIIYAGIIVFGTVGSNILNLIRVRKYIYFTKLGKYNIKQHIKPIIVFALFSVASKIYNSLDGVMLGFLSNETEAGYYSAAVKMKNIVISLVTALGTVLLPRVSYYVEMKMEKDFKRVIKKSFTFIFFMAFPMVVFFIVQSMDTILLLAGGEYINAVPAMQVIFPTVFFIGMSNIIGMQIFVPLKLEKYTVLSTVVGAVVDLILNFIFIPKFGALGAAIGTTVAEFSVLLVQIVLLIKIKYGDYIKINLVEIIKVVIATMISTVIMILVKNIIVVDIRILRYVILGAIYWITCLIVCFIFKEDILYEILNKFRKKQIDG